MWRQEDLLRSELRLNRDEFRYHAELAKNQAENFLREFNGPQADHFRDVMWNPLAATIQAGVEVSTHAYAELGALLLRLPPEP